MSKSHKIRDWNLPSLLTQEFSKVIKKLPKGFIFVMCITFEPSPLWNYVWKNHRFQIIDHLYKKLHLHFKWFGNLILNKQRPKISVHYARIDEKSQIALHAKMPYIFENYTQMWTFWHKDWIHMCTRSQNTQYSLNKFKFFTNKKFFFR